jgi:lysozyme family protein
MNQVLNFLKFIKEYKNVFDSLKTRPKLIKKEVNLQSLNRNLLQITGQTTIPFQSGGIKMSHSFYVASGSIIYNHDWISIFSIHVNNCVSYHNY